MNIIIARVPVLNGAECRYCMQKFSSAKEIKDHKEAVHDQSSYPFSCPVCSKEFKQQAHRDSHVRTHTGDRPYECEHCWMAFKQSSHLRRHILRRHCQNSDRPFSCDKCSQRYAQQWDLDLHYRSHHCSKGSTQSHPYKCGKCGRAFTQLSNLRAHERKVTCTNDYHCPHCSYGFDDEVSYTAHVKCCPSKSI